ncbi:MAG: patatin-like phospholipase family protein [Acidobacteriota bacterium]
MPGYERKQGGLPGLEAHPLTSGAPNATGAHHVRQRRCRTSSGGPLTHSREGPVSIRGGATIPALLQAITPREPGGESRSDPLPNSTYKPDPNRSGIGLCLSGGGFRAALFHLGAMRRLNEVGLLRDVRTISSVSGGSVASALLAKKWRALSAGAAGSPIPWFGAYEQELRAFCSADLRTGPLLTGRLNPLNWHRLWGRRPLRDGLLADAYEDRLVGDMTLADLSAIQKAGRPSFVFGAANMQTGVDFTFSGAGVHDWKLGTASTPEVLKTRVADAVAASSAFTIAFPPLVLKFETAAFQQESPPRTGCLIGTPEHRALTRRTVLTDGGVYDNIGTEPVWKDHETVLVSDGGKPFSLDVDPGEAAISRLSRANSVIANQAEAVRKRWLISSLQDGVYKGTYWGIGTEIEGYPQRNLAYPATHASKLLERLRAVRTDFDTFSTQEQLVLMNHGWVLADAALRSYLSMGAPAGTPPSQTLLTDHEASAKALEHSGERDLLGR